MENTEAERNFDNLRNYYPKVIELFKWELLRRNNDLPTEINDLIFSYLLNLNSLNGKSCLANKYLKIREKEEKTNKSLEVKFLQNFLVESEESKKKMEKRFSETLSRFWKNDKDKLLICKQIAFNSLKKS